MLQPARAAIAMLLISISTASRPTSKICSTNWARCCRPKGLLDSSGNAVVGTYPEVEGGALWNYIYVKEDRSMGVHNAPYIKAPTANNAL